MHDENHDRSDAIAVIGMAGKFPGANDVREFWSNLQGGVESIRSFTEDELKNSGVSEDVLRDPNFVNAGAPMPGADCFDAAFFGYNPREAELMDPQQRVFLECAWAAMEDAGHDAARFDGDIGVFGGVARSTYLLQNAATYKELMDKGATYDVILGTDKDYPATRVAYQMNLHGPAMSVQTACSTSGVAIHMACQSLLNGECDMAMAGGARIQVPETGGYLWMEGGIPSPDGHCRPFDKQAAGTVYGSGVGVVVLKRYEDAVADGDNIYSVILGSTLNNDGSEKAGFTAPSPSGQAAAIKNALDIADVSADQIGYVEAHGTGTLLGDPIEISALTKAYRSHTDRAGYCAIGSLKSNIGHLDAGAGVAGLIKASLMLHHKMLVPSINYSEPNPQIDFANSPFYVATETAPWPAGSTPRRAAVSSFGLGGTNFHAILEEAPGVEDQVADSGDWKLVPLSAKTSGSLTDVAGKYAAETAITPGTSIDAVCHTLVTGRKQFPVRRVTAARSVDELREIVASDNGLFSRFGSASGARCSIAFMFPGQGGQYPSMGQGLYEREPAFRDAMDECRHHFRQYLEMDIWDAICRNIDDCNEDLLLDQTWITQPAVFAVEYALARLWQSFGIEPDFLAGHSFGEIAAGCIAGIFTLPGAVHIVAERGRLTHSAPPGAMLAVGLGEDDLLETLPGGIDIATVNTPAACVVSGPIDSIRDLQEKLQAQDVANSLLKVSNGFHSSMMNCIVDEFTQVIAAQSMSQPRIPVISSVTGQILSDNEASDPSYWANQVIKPVRMMDSIGCLLKSEDAILIETGPGKSLSSFAIQHPDKRATQHTIPSIRQPDDDIEDSAFFRLSLGQAWCCGLDIDLNELNSPEEQRRVSLPTYAFERKRYWLSATATMAPAVAATSSRATGVCDTPDDGKSRPDRILAALLQTLSDMSGFAPSELDPRKSFVELGFDSLFLTRANTEFKKLCGIDIGFKQLFDEAPTLELLAAYVDRELPADSTLFEAPSSSMPGTTSSERSAHTSNLGDPILHQLDSIQAQLADIRSAHVDGGAQRAMTYRTPFFDGESSADAKPVGPWRPIATGDFGQLSTIQQRHLATLIERLVEKTRQSRDYTQKHRAHLADPRTIAGFRRIWKEMVYPVVVDRSKGAEVWDLDGNKYTDMTMGFGVGFLGHNPPFVMEAIHKQLEKGVEIGPQHPLAGEVAKKICDLTNMERAAFCNTGSEAVLAAIRMSRTITGKNRIVVFAGDYHGIFDEVLATRNDSESGSRSVPVSPGIPNWSVEQTLVLEYGDDRSLDTIRDYASDIAAIIVEPVQSRRPELQPIEFVRKLRSLATELDIPFVLDEIITGFRCHPGGVQALWGIEADIATYGKAVGGGFPISVVAGKRKYMDALDGGYWTYGDDSFPEVGVTWFAGTFVRHPVALAAANATLDHYQAKGSGLQSTLNRDTEALVDDLNEFLSDIDVPIHIECFSSFFLIRFRDHQEISSLLYAHLRDRGIHLTEGRAAFLSTAHSAAHFEHFKGAFKESVLALQEGGFLPSTSATVARRAQTDNATHLPLTAGQSEIWLGAAFDDDANCAFNLTCSIRLHGVVELDRMVAALQLLVDRHESLRTSFAEDGSSQEIHDCIEVDVPIHDLSAQDASAAEDSLNTILTIASESPMDLTSAPLFHPQIIRLSKLETVVSMTVHHIICDGWSTGNLMRELGSIYTQLAAGRAPSLGNPSQLSDLIRLCDSDEYRVRQASARKYWIQHLSGDTDYLLLPTDRERPAVRSYCASRIDLQLPDELCEQLREFSRTKQYTLFQTLLAAYVAFLARLSNQSSFVIGVSAAQQAVNNMPDLVAHCISMLPVKFDVDFASTVGQHLTRVKKNILNAFDHQDCTYGELLPSLQLDRTIGQPPLINTAFNLDPSALGINFGELSAQVGSAPRQFEIFDIFFNIVDTGPGLKIECTFNRSLFDLETISNRLAGFETLLGDICSGSDLEIQELVIAADKELETIRKSNATDTVLRWPRRVDKLVGQFTTDSNRIAIKCKSESISYRELQRRSNQLANYLADRNIRPESTVGIYMHRSSDMIVAMLAVMKAGCAYLPLDPLFPQDRLTYMLTDSGATALITEHKLGRQLAAFKGQAIDLDVQSTEIEACSTELPGIETSDDALAYVLYTSGSTGRPKGVKVPHRCVTNFLESMAAKPGLTEADTFAAVTTTSFDISVLEIFLPLSVDATVVVATYDESSDGERLRSLLEAEDVTAMQATPSTWRMLLDSGWRSRKNFKVLCGGESLPANLASDLLSACSELWNMYGPTETTIWSTCARITDADSPIVIGQPIANTRVHVLGKNQYPVPVGVAGELFISGKGLALGYVNQPELTDSVFLPDPFDGNPSAKMYRTGDRVRWLGDGTLEHLGRIGNQVKIRGFRIELGEIESVLVNHPAIKAAACNVWPVSPEDQRLVAYLVFEPDQSVSSIEIRKHLRVSLPDYMVPQYFETIEAIPLTPNGKTDRRSLPLPTDAYAGDNYEDPITDTEVTIASIWRETIGTDKVGRHDNFFDLGGHSLLAIRSVGEIEAKTGYRPAPRLLVMENLAEIARIVDGETASSSPVDEKPRKRHVLSRWFR